MVDAFRRISVSGDEITYALRIVPHIALMQHTQRSEVYLNQSVPEVVEQLLRSHGLEGADFEFRLSQHYPVRELITQWRETDLEFIQRLLAELGIFWRFEMDTRLVPVTASATWVIFRYRKMADMMSAIRYTSNA
ncbi:hypothetical protein Pcaca05_08190 [Pectobacterium carotovorum subsp. carotovorum]|nr:hypothetical protein Pcaca05_08190 [Pectobacterium carotovorum subsp. carotovorum]